MADDGQSMDDDQSRILYASVNTAGNDLPLAVSSTGWTCDRQNDASTQQPRTGKGRMDDDN